ncbi:ATP synthase subunit I [Aquabacterium sp.]|uniref:ATP synthase subunit I n=1 Tax=Aquabacterium sp. TaxID=1872578 RepID=UPI0019CAD470|nr:ATP synthase subunit I [Aquabacterium sp.]MBC7700585.1 ATP synthase subunit I [Aquabacterium sp.]
MKPPALSVTLGGARKIEEALGGFVDDLEAGEAPIRQWSRDEVEALRLKRPAVSLWRVVAIQALAGMLLALVFWVLGGHRSNVVWSALYGAACVVVPGALFAHGMSRQVSAINAGAAVFGFMLWEFLKIGVAVIMLVAAVKVVPHLSWPAFLAALIVCIKLNWLALFMQGRVKKNVASDNR